MNSQENNWTSNSGESSSQVSLLSIDFKIKLNRKLDEKIASLESEIAKMTAEIAAWKDNVKTRFAKIKETKKEINASKKRNKELEDTRDNVRQSAEELTRYIQLLKTNLKQYREENTELEKEHRESVEDMENKWIIYQAEYETLPLAVVRSKIQTALNKAKIELMVKQHKLAEMKKTVAKQEENDTKRRNNLVIECAELYKDSKSEENMMRFALTTQKNLQEEIRRQETTIRELTEKQKEQLAAKQLSVAGKSGEKIVSLFTPSQRRSQQFPRFDLSAIAETLTQPIPTFHKDDYDTISITSSVIDNLIEPGNLPSTETNKYGPSEVNNEPSEAALMDPNNITITVKEDCQVPEKDQEEPNPSANQRFKDIDNKEVASERLHEESIADEQVDTQETEEYDSPKTTAEEVETNVEEFYEQAKEQAAEAEYSITSEAPKEKHRRSFLSQSNCPQQRELGETQIKRPRILNIENVQLNIPPRKPTNPKPPQEDSLARYFAASAGSGVDYNWRANYPPSMSSFQDSQRGNAEVESILGSEMSMQSEDIMKKFQFSFSPEREHKEELGDSQPQYVTPRATNAGPSSPKTAAPFLDMRNLGTPTSRGNKKDQFFLSMF